MPLRENNMDEILAKKKIEDIADERIRQQLQSGLFNARKLTDTPTDDLQVVPRRYVTNNGTVRPTSSVVGQPFLDMNLASGRGKPIYWNGTGWIDATGTYV